MYQSYTGGRNLYGELTNDTSTTNLTNGDLYINADIGRLLGKRDWPFLYRERTAQTTANQQSVEIPRPIKKVKTVAVESGSSRWHPREVPNRDFWNRLNYTIATAHTSDYPDWYFVENGELLFHPTPSTTRTVYISGRIGLGRLNIADYTTGTVTSVLGSARITGAGTTWTNSMVGRFIRLTASDTANSGDDEWYEIESVPSTTAIDLKKPYVGQSVTANSNAYTIGQMSPLPDGYQEAPIYRGVQKYYTGKNIPGAGDKALMFKQMADDLEEQLADDYGSATDNVVLEDEDLDDRASPNLFVRL